MAGSRMIYCPICNPECGGGPFIPVLCEVCASRNAAQPSGINGLSEHIGVESPMTSGNYMGISRIAAFVKTKYCTECRVRMSQFQVGPVNVIVCPNKDCSRYGVRIEERS